MTGELCHNIDKQGREQGFGVKGQRGLREVLSAWRTVSWPMRQLGMGLSIIKALVGWRSE